MRTARTAQTDLERRSGCTVRTYTHPVVVEGAKSREEKDFRSVRSAVSLEKETHVHVGSYELDLAVAAEIHLGVSVVVVAVGRFVGVGVGRWFVIDNPRLDQFYFISVPIWLGIQRVLPFPSPSQHTPQPRSAWVKPRDRSAIFQRQNVKKWDRSDFAVRS